jgi:hypothetical protein
VVENGLMCRYELYEPDNRQAIIARFAELGGGQGPLGDRPPERNLAAYCRCFAAGDLEGLVALHADDFRRVDHRCLGWEASERTDQQQVLFESFFAAGSDMWWQVDEALACDDRVIALMATLHGTSREGSGPFEIPFGLVAVIEDGRRTEEHLYQPDDRQAMLARYAELGSTTTPASEHG